MVLMSSMVIWSLMVMLRMNKSSHWSLRPLTLFIIWRTVMGSSMLIYSPTYLRISSSRPSFPSFQRRRMERTVNSLEMEATCRMLSFLIFSWFSRFP